MFAFNLTAPKGTARFEMGVPYMTEELNRTQLRTCPEGVSCPYPSFLGPRLSLLPFLAVSYELKPGTYSPIQNATECISPSPGYYAGAGAWEQTACPAGSASEAPFLECEPVRPYPTAVKSGGLSVFRARYGPSVIVGLTIAFQCEAGYYSSEVGDECDACPVGTFSSEPGATQVRESLSSLSPPARTHLTRNTQVRQLHSRHIRGRGSRRLHALCQGSLKLLASMRVHITQCHTLGDASLLIRWASLL
jgi:hypothetical protein